MRHIFSRADLIVTVSEFTRRRVIELFSIEDEKKLIVIPNGVSNCYFEERQSSDAATLSRFGLQPYAYVMAVGSLTFRKGGDLLLKLAQRLYRDGSGLRLIVTGRRHDQLLLDEYETLRRGTSDLPIHLTGYLSEEEQAVLLRNATGLVFPSRYEGFGIPVLEAMAAATPVICSRAGALPEVAGEAAVFANTVDCVDEWLDLIRLTQQAPCRSALTEKGLQKARQFKWRTSADLLVRAMADAP